MRSFRKFTLFTTLFVYIVIFAGGLVRVAGAGLGCPDWPKCFGRWIPPTSIDQLPPDIDPAQFNIVLAWIEYSNRIGGMLVGILIAATAVWAVAKFRQFKSIVILSIASALLVTFQGWHGSVVVKSELEQSIVSVHYFLALLIAGLMIFTYVQSYNLDNENRERKYTMPMDLRIWSMVLFIMALTQIFLGTQIRAVLESLTLSFPLMSDAERLNQVGLINHIHLALGLTTAAITFVFCLRVRTLKDSISPLINHGATLAAILVLMQMALGSVFIIFGLVPIVQLFHLCIASMFLGVLIMILSVAFTNRAE